MKPFLLSSILLAACLGMGCQTAKGIDNESSSTVADTLCGARFTTSDSALERTYRWAQRMALSYAHPASDLATAAATDPVGPWYEAALPQREAFCMRDVSHQTVGAQILGLGRHNRNMMQRFAENITQAKDWCSYWEINRYNLPAPADYTNDREFWYNLNANTDVLQACLKLYEWTGDESYLRDPVLVNFYEKSMNEYLVHWQLQPDRIMDRPQYMHQPVDFDPANNFHACRGLASYVENFRRLTVGVDLIATLYAGHKAYSEMLALIGYHAAGRTYATQAKAYRSLLDTRWWDESRQRYHTFWTVDREFHSGEGEPFILWFGATDRPERVRATMRSILAQEWNVENLSAFPALFYRLGYVKEAYEKLIALPDMKRSEYPEVSFGAIEGVVGGVMGITPQASKKQITTLPQLLNESDWVTITNLPVFGGTITVKHNGNCWSELVNNTGQTVNWQVSFKGKHETFLLGGRSCTASIRTDETGNVISYVNVKVKNGEKISATAST